MTLKAYISVYTPMSPSTHSTLNTHINRNTHASDHYGLIFCQTSDWACLPLADNCVRGDFFLPHFWQMIRQEAQWCIKMSA